MPTDLHLLQRYHRHGDAEAFQALVEAHAGMVHATACRITRDAALAQDVAQETFLALARSSGAAVQSVGAWLHHVAWQKALNTVRGESRRRSHEAAAAADAGADSATSAHSPGAADDAAAWAELEPVLDEALAELPEPVRALIVARYLEGRTQQDLAARLGISQSTVSRQLEAALHALRARLRARGVLGGAGAAAGLAALLGSHSASAAPAGLTAALGKVSISGLGAQAAAAPAGAATAMNACATAATTTSLITMTTTTKILTAATGLALAIASVPWVFPRSAAPPPRKPPAQAQAAPISRSTDRAPAETREEPRRHYRPAPVSPQVRKAVDDIVRRHQAMTPAELVESPEMQELVERFITVLDRPETQAKLDERYEAMRGVKQGRPRFDFQPVGTARGRAWLEAVVSGDAQRVEDWMLNILDDAVFEFAFDPDLERTSNGVSFDPLPPAPPQAPADAEAND